MEIFNSIVLALSLLQAIPADKPATDSASVAKVEMVVITPRVQPAP